MGGVCLLLLCMLDLLAWTMMGGGPGPRHDAGGKVYCRFCVGRVFALYPNLRGRDYPGKESRLDVGVDGADHVDRNTGHVHHRIVCAVASGCGILYTRANHLRSVPLLHV